MKILIASPVYKRSWILPEWFSYIERQDFPLNQIGFLFEAGPNDPETLEYLFKWHSAHPQVLCFDVNVNTEVKHQEHHVGQRRWTKDRYHHMVMLRNSLLDRAVGCGFDRYFSLDTDILLEDPSTISSLADFAEKPCAVAPLMFMTPLGTGAPSVMSWTGVPGGVARRKKNYPLGTLFKSDIIMAAKMMNKKVYESVKYKWHQQGEDLGWSHQCYIRGFPLYSMSNIYAPHIMSERMLERYKISGDARHRQLMNGNKV